MKKASKTNWDALGKLADKDIDTSDIGELGDDFFANDKAKHPIKNSWIVSHFLHTEDGLTLT